MLPSGPIIQSDVSFKLCAVLSESFLSQGNQNSCFLFNCMTVGQASDSMTALTQSFNLLVGV